MILSCYTVVSRYFSKRRNLAIQVLCGGATVGGFVYSPLIQILIDNYTWRGALMVLTLFLNYFNNVCSVLGFKELFIFFIFIKLRFFKHQILF